MKMFCDKPIKEILRNAIPKVENSVSYLLVNYVEPAVKIALTKIPCPEIYLRESGASKWNILKESLGVGLPCMFRYRPLK